MFLPIPTDQNDYAVLNTDSFTLVETGYKTIEEAQKAAEQFNEDYR